jgi:hypothetical protein
MNRLFCSASVILIIAFVGCSHKQEAKAELEKAAEVLAKGDAEPASPAPPSETPAPLPADAPTETSTAPVVPPSQQMKQALAAYKDGKMEDAVTRLQKLRAVNSLTPQQRMAVQDSVAAVMNEIYELAAKGNAKAIQAVRQYEDMQTRPH